MIIIGIDPPKGLALWDTEARKFIKIETVEFWDIIHEISTLKDAGKIAVVVEAPQANKSLFFRHEGNKQRVLQRIAQNVGSNKRDSVLIIEYCSRVGVKCVPVPPRRKNSTKHSPEMFARWTGWTGRTSEHGRDGAALVFGMGAL